MHSSGVRTYVERRPADETAGSVWAMSFFPPFSHGQMMVLGGCGPSDPAGAPPYGVGVDPRPVVYGRADATIDRRRARGPAFI